jgi:peptide-methionine (S)-S-oxide reductase
MKAAPDTAAASTNKTELATFGGGCFWCTEAVYQTLDGVKKVTSGYAGGKTENPTYEQVCTGDTGHAEVIQVEFDPSVISYSEILSVFWQAHDPTTLNRQGHDTGTQYRSIILYHNDAQKTVAQKSKDEEAAKLGKQVVTEIVPFTKFYPAESYHADYYRRNMNKPYCNVVIKPKLEKLQKNKVIPVK